MRTTHDIEPEVLEMAKDLAKSQATSLGKMVSSLLRHRKNILASICSTWHE